MASLFAAVLGAVGQPLEIQELPDPAPQSGELLIEVSACGVCHTDLHVIKGEVGFPLPAVLGHEISGVVAGVGPHTSGFAPGDRVVSSFIMPCGTCRRCVRGHDDMCETFFALNRLRGVLYDGTTRLHRDDGSPVWMYSMGGLAQRCVVPATAVFRIPDELALSDVATLGCSSLTAYGAIRNVAQIRPGDSVAVVAAGGVGSSLIQLAAVFGAPTIIAIDLAEDKLAAATRLGATHVVNAAKVDPVEAVREITGGDGVSVAFEAFGSSKSFDTAAGVVADGGRVVVVGIAPAGDLGQLDLARLVRRKIRVLGSYGGRVRTDMPALIDLVHRGVFSPQDTIRRRYRLDDAAAAYQDLAAGQVIGRAVIDMSRGPVTAAEPA